MKEEKDEIEIKVEKILYEGKKEVAEILNARYYKSITAEQLYSSMLKDKKAIVGRIERIMLKEYKVQKLPELSTDVEMKRYNNYANMLFESIVTKENISAILKSVRKH